MNKRQILDPPFSIDVDGNGDATVNPTIAGSSRCWFEYRNGRLCFCCQTPQGIRCYCANITIENLSATENSLKNVLSKGASVVVISIVVLAILLTVADLPFDPPAAWIVSWTAWIGAVIGIVSGTRILWVGGNALAEYVRRCG